jgi:hypothetical protein
MVLHRPWYQQWWDFLSGGHIHFSPIGGGILLIVIGLVVALALLRKR